MDATAQQVFWKDPKNIHGGGPAEEAAATAEQTFSKRPLNFCKEYDHLKVEYILGIYLKKN